ncbi:hypothetical protein V3C99_010777 [Haemonchus contortus]|uniref:Inhibitor I9 domain-containing protein n=1 Tax=Haemonchus contortus TaxID=6289 RepID=A0A7I5E893_HAECO|nr:unnamed protein product [Haemonchus contortus]
MKGLLFALVVISVIAVYQAIPPPKDIGNGKEHLHIVIASRFKTNDLEKEIKDYGSRLGTVKKLKAMKHKDHFNYKFAIYNADCNKVIGWMKDVVKSTKDIVGAALNCDHKYGTYITKDTTKTVDFTKKKYII